MVMSFVPRFLVKQSKFLHEYTKHWFVLTRDHLYGFKKRGEGNKRKTATGSGLSWICVHLSIFDYLMESTLNITYSTSKIIVCCCFNQDLIAYIYIYRRDVWRCHLPGDYSQCLERILLNEPITTLWNGGGNVWCNLVISNSFLPVNLIVFEEVFWLMIVFAVSYVDVLDLTHARFTCMLCKICKYGSFCGILMYFVVGYPNIQVSTTCIMYIDMIYLFIYLYIFFVFQERWRKYKYTLARYRCLHHLWQYN